jgi:hypothetical protein
MISTTNTKTNLKSDTRLYGQNMSSNTHNITFSPYNKKQDDELYEGYPESKFQWAI